MRAYFLESVKHIETNELYNMRLKMVHRRTALV